MTHTDAHWRYRQRTGASPLPLAGYEVAEMARIRRRWKREAAWSVCKLIVGVGLVLFVVALFTVPR